MEIINEVINALPPDVIDMLYAIGEVVDNVFRVIFAIAHRLMELTTIILIPSWLIYYSPDKSSRQSEMKLAKKRIKKEAYNAEYTKERCEKIIADYEQYIQRERKGWRGLLRIEIILLVIYLTYTGYGLQLIEYIAEQIERL